ncbi:hypothetical protein HDU67_006959 [Dinochytrium kinnereticum]|nr:hypothetical protein HDU67_006959 [Dinochytrium kinnereticum]
MDEPTHLNRRIHTTLRTPKPPRPVFPPAAPNPITTSPTSPSSRGDLAIRSFGNRAASHNDRLGGVRDDYLCGDIWKSEGGNKR